MLATTKTVDEVTYLLVLHRRERLSTGILHRNLNLARNMRMCATGRGVLDKECVRGRVELYCCFDTLVHHIDGIWKKSAQPFAR